MGAEFSEWDFKDCLDFQKGSTNLYSNTGFCWPVFDFILNALLW